MSRDDAWNTYVEALALLAKAEEATAAAREGLAAAQEEEESLRLRMHEAREQLEAIAQHEAGGLWISLEHARARRDLSVPPPSSVLREIRDEIATGTAV
jgi:hypothetical protein